MLSEVALCRSSRALWPSLGRAASLAGAPARAWSSRESDGNEDGLPALQQAKALLSGNARAQLTTVRAEAPAAGEEPKVTSCLVHAPAPRGLPPLLLLHPALHAQALHDIAAADAHTPASLCYGGTDPPALVQRLRAIGWQPPRLLLLGTLRPLPSSELAFQLGEARRCWQGTALEAQLPPDEELGQLRGFTMPEPSTCLLVAGGARQELDPEAVDAALLDPLASHQQDLLTLLSDDPGWQTALQLFCAGYLGVETAPGAVATSADRRGLSVLAPGAAGPPEAAPPRWHQFRFAFQREARGPQEFLRILETMREEVLEAAREGPGDGPGTED